jgi:hypothetical protein
MFKFKVVCANYIISTAMQLILTVLEVIYRRHNRYRYKLKSKLLTYMIQKKLKK